MATLQDKGDSGVGFVIADLLRRGIKVLLPLSEHLPFDLVTYHESALLRVQVKYRAAKGGRVAFMLRNGYADRNGTHRVPLSLSSVDVFAVYCPDSEHVYYVSSCEVSSNRASFEFRLVPSKIKNGRSHLASEYLDPLSAFRKVGREA